jgi:hypothetical protein
MTEIFRFTQISQLLTLELAGPWCSAGVENTTHNPKIEGSNRSIGNGKKENVQNILLWSNKASFNMQVSLAEVEGSVQLTFLY